MTKFTLFCTSALGPLLEDVPVIGELKGRENGDEEKREMTYDLDPMNKRVLILRLPMNVWFLLKFV
jgi:hypothetical protein